MVFFCLYAPPEAPPEAGPLPPAPLPPAPLPPERAKIQNRHRIRPPEQEQRKTRISPPEQSKQINNIYILIKC